ncbi:hypothetical protein ACFWHW_23495 [Streptomyces pharetrae]|uniref:hypothetical protein n=1 Tax=Streptomyces pharetrae TaxID=291370 RepID=UPI0036645DA1
MRTPPGLRILTAALLTGGTLAATAVGTTPGAAPPALSEGRGVSASGSSSGDWGWLPVVR